MSPPPMGPPLCTGHPSSMRHAPNHAALFHEGEPRSFRAWFGRELERSTGLDAAVTRIRLTTLDLTPEELRNARAIRLLLAEVRAVALDAEAHALVLRPRSAQRLALLTGLLDAGIVQVRASPLGGWSPDFSVFRDPEGPRAVLLGFHAFERPHPFPGPAFGARFGRPEAAVAALRFERLWSHAHDVAPALHTLLHRARRWSRLPQATSPPVRPQRYAPSWGPGSDLSGADIGPREHPRPPGAGPGQPPGPPSVDTPLDRI